MSKKTFNQPPKPKPVKASGPGIGSVKPPVNAVTGATMTPQGPGPAAIRSTPLPPNFGTALGVATPRPFDPTHDNQVGLNNRTYNDTITGLDAERDQTLRNYGLDDQTDPFSLAKALELAWHQRDTGITNSMASRGQLYSGANQNAHDSSNTSYIQGRDTLRKQQSGVLAAIERKRGEAGTNRDQGNLNADSASLDRAVNTPVNPLDVPAKQPVKPNATTANQPLKKKKRFQR